MVSFATIQPTERLHCKVFENWRYLWKLMYCGMKSVTKKPVNHTDFYKMHTVHYPEWRDCGRWQALSQQVSIILAAPK